MKVKGESWCESREFICSSAAPLLSLVGGGNDGVESIEESGVVEYT